MITYIFTNHTVFSISPNAIQPASYRPSHVNRTHRRTRSSAEPSMKLFSIVDTKRAVANSACSSAQRLRCADFLFPLSTPPLTHPLPLALVPNKTFVKLKAYFLQLPDTAG